ncbi:MAG: ABC transporter permease, partial [Promethearchaeota archaeon]
MLSKRKLVAAFKVLSVIGLIILILYLVVKFIVNDPLLEKEIWNTLIFSIYVSSVSTVIAASIGIPLGIYLGIKEFKGKSLILNMTNSFMGFPPVVMGLIVFLLLSRSGPLGSLGILFTPSAIIIAQTCLAIPIITGVTVS